MKDWLRLLGYARRYWLMLLGSIILMAIVGAAQAAIPLLIRLVIDKVLRPEVQDEPVVLFDKFPFLSHPIYLNQFVPFHLHNILNIVAFGIIMAFVLKGVCDYAANYLISYSGLSVVTDLRNTVFEKVLRQGAEFFESNSTGRLMSSVMNDIEKIQTATSNMLADLLRQIFTVTALLVVVTQTNWRLALVSLTVLPVVLIPTARIGRRIRSTSRRTQEHVGELSQILQETISGHAVVHAFNAEKYELSRFRAAAKRLLRSNLRYVVQQSIASPLIEICGAMTVVGLLWYARLEIKGHDLSAGGFMAFIVALLMMYEPVKRLTGIHNIFQQAIGAAQKVFEYLDREEDIVEKPKAPKLERFAKTIRFEEVTFRYPTAEGYQLHSINLEVKAGEVVALVGPSGAGKSTLANLVPRFYDVAGGSIRIDGKDIRDFTIASLRGKIGLVAQDTFLFNDTVARNIAYGRTDVPFHAIKEAARNALAHEFIEALPNGYETSIGERGVRLSGGQRQRLSIARAMLKNAPILILDEATSHLDTESELLVQRALANLMVDRTVIVIAHRISTIRRADKIVVIDRGQIVETGSHDELVRGKGIYQRLHELQFMTAGVSAGVSE